MAFGAKQIETRSWSTTYRGPLAIHASKRAVISELMDMEYDLSWAAAMGLCLGADVGIPTVFLDELPFGAIVAVCELVDCRRTGSFAGDILDYKRRRDGYPCAISHWTERMLGDYSLGRFGWVTENMRRLERPIPYRGRPGLFDIPDSVFADLGGACPAPTKGRVL
jgi:hypothetical protein